MASLISKRIVVAVGFLAVVLPVVSRIFSSPFFLLLASPLILSIFALSYFLLYVYFAWYLDSQRTQTPNYLHHAARPFYFSTPAAWEVVMTRSQWSQNTPQSFPSLYPDFPDVSDTLNDIISMVIREFVDNWYSQLSSSPAFPIAVNSIIRYSLEQTVTRASSIDVPSLIVKRILPKVTAHIDQFRESEVALRGAGLERRLTQSEELDLLLASRYASKGGKLHHAVENLSTTFTRQTEEAHIRQLVDRALPFILPPNERKSKTLRIVAREILACSVLYPVIEMVTDPDFWNRTIDQVVSMPAKSRQSRVTDFCTRPAPQFINSEHYSAGTFVCDFKFRRQLISKVRNLLEVQLPRYRSNEPPSMPSAPSVPVPMERITIRTNPRQFESFLRSITRCSSLLDARRLKNDIVGEIRRTRLLLANHDKDDWIEGEKTEDVVAFLDRLYTAKRKVEERIVVLGGGQDTSSVCITTIVLIY
jgi:sorting nexin-25